jgi:hypothetical protein
MDNRRRQRTYAIFAIFMVVLMAATAILPSIAPNTTLQQDIEPTATVIPTFPAPPADLSEITFDQTYLHPSALYLVDYPEDWAPSRPSNNGTQVQVNFENTAAQSIIETYIEVPQPAPQSLQDVSARYDDSTLDAGWRRYNDWEETGRELDVENNAVVIDFELTLRGQTFLARHYAELRDGRIYVTRVVTPSNARELLLDLLDKARNAIHPVELFEDTPVEWNGYYSGEDNLVVRYPNSWALRDGGPGQPVTIELTGQAVLRIETVEGAVANEDAARAFIEARQPGATIRTIRAAERNGASGWEVSYSYRTLEGEPQSALAVILPDGENTLRVATVRVANQDVDLLDNTVTVTTVRDAAAVAETFNLTTGLNFPVAEDEGEGDTEATG